MEGSIKKIFDSYYIKRSILPIKDMENHLEYNLTKIEKVGTKFGSRIRCLLNNQYYVYLPELFLALTQEQMEYINGNLFQIVRRSEKLYIEFRKNNNCLFYDNLSTQNNDVIFYAET